MNSYQWFLNEFGQYGFTLSMTQYDANTFMPIKVVCEPGSGRFTRIRLSPELADDLHGWGMTHDHHVEALRELIRMEIRGQYSHLLRQDFKPIEKIPKLNFI